jgi:hypothetical protein
MRQAVLYYCCDFAMDGSGCDATSDAQSIWTKATAAAKAGGGCSRAGSTEWKLSGDARDCIHEAALLHKWVHIGRVNSLTRIWRFSHRAVDSVDGTYLKHGPDINTEHLGRRLDCLATEPPLWRDYHPLASAENAESRHPSFP